MATRTDITTSAVLQADACLTYANTLSWRGRATPIEELRDFGNLLQWTARTLGLDTDVVRQIEREARAQPAIARDLFADAIALRETIYRIFRALASGAKVSDRDLAALNAALAAAPPRDRLTRSGAGFAWQIGTAAITAPALLAPILWSAGDLLASDQHRRVRLCANDECLWLFLDESKAGTRRWCNMAACGNRAKARRHYQRSRRGGSF